MRKSGAKANTGRIRGKRGHKKLCDDSQRGRGYKRRKGRRRRAGAQKGQSCQTTGAEGQQDGEDGAKGENGTKGPEKGAKGRERRERHERGQRKGIGAARGGTPPPLPGGLLLHPQLFIFTKNPTQMGLNLKLRGS